MGFLCAVVMMVIICVITWTVSRWDANTAYRLFEHSSQHFFDVESPVTHGAPVNRATGKFSPAVNRPFISPLVKKRVAAKQKWRCGACRQLLDETFEIDHRTPLYKGGHPTDGSNL